MRSAVLIALMLLLLVPGVAHADYVITLRTGREIVTRRYRESGDKIFYKRFGGEMGIKKTGVAFIEDRSTGEIRLIHKPYTPAELQAFRNARQAEITRTNQKAERRDALRAAGEPAEILNVKLTTRRTSGSYEYRLLGEARNSGDTVWERASILVRVYNGHEFIGQFTAHLRPNSIYPGGTGTFDTFVSRDIGYKWNQLRPVYTFLQKYKQ